MELLQHSVAQRAGRGNAQAVAARAPTVHEPVPQDEGAMRTGSRGRLDSVGEQRGRQRAEIGVSWQGGVACSCEVCVTVILWLRDVSLASQPACLQ